VRIPIGLFSTALAWLSPKVSIGIRTSSKQGLEEGESRKTERWGMAEATAAWKNYGKRPKEKNRGDSEPVLWYYVERKVVYWITLCCTRGAYIYRLAITGIHINSPCGTIPTYNLININSPCRTKHTYNRTSIYLVEVKNNLLSLKCFMPMWEISYDIPHLLWRVYYFVRALSAALSKHISFLKYRKNLKKEWVTKITCSRYQLVFSLNIEFATLLPNALGSTLASI